MEQFGGLSTGTTAPSPHRSLPSTDFCPPLHRGCSEWLIIPDNQVCLSCWCSVRFMWKCPACTSCRLDCSCDRLSWSAASGSERGLIIPCPRAGSASGLVRITWSWPCDSLSEVFQGRLNNSRLPWHSHVSTNESSHQKSKVGQPSSSFSTGRLAAAQQQINSLRTAAQLGRF